MEAKATWLCGCVVVMKQLWSWSQSQSGDHDSGCGLAIATDSGRGLAITKWQWLLCDRDSGGCGRVEVFVRSRWMQYWSENKFQRSREENGVKRRSLKPVSVRIGAAMPNLYLVFFYTHTNEVSLIYSNYGYFSEIRSLQSLLAPISNFLIEHVTLEIKARSPILSPPHHS